MNLERYSEEDKKVIEKYFGCLRDGRLTGKVSPAILDREVKYWEKFSVDVVIEIFTDEGDVVIDPCAGSASTLRAAAELNRHAFGFEVDKKFYKRAREEMLLMF